MHKIIMLKLLVGMVGLAALFVLLALAYSSTKVENMDHLIISALTAYQPGELTRLFIWITNSAAKANEWLSLLIFSVFFIIWRRKWLEPAVLMISLFTIRYGNFFLKDVYERKRPSVHQLVEIGGYSFPSGHAMISAGFFGLLFYFLAHHINQTWAKRLVAVLGSLYIMLVGISRIYLGVHYPSDVAAGFLAGGCMLLLFIVIYQLAVFILWHERKS
ncbi:phosphatase PAP2 family protein [Fictibacillus fluitans]|uniref:Phosphatase PAP2 family protein n=1 Tax=Fictibacillus fluitans TaxID=3058422 RepID=A0ABT8HWT0_9BACL|nr:phosphatase PAP2 family protein [Fictibacillus sp. NE201]MDN4525237.1 phosphatase PAP2 family protein [Fictibacillus sp. NE201]